ncbi:MAG: hypothetical protein HRT53_16800 [Colwellia sp.]|nr:hypothetical protein [Colwellia sp.]
MNKLLSEQDLQKEVAALPDELTPQRDLWLGIERAIQVKKQDELSFEPSTKKVFIPTAWAASLVAAVLVTWVSFSPNFSSQPVELVDKNNSPLNLVLAMQENFQQTKQTMLISFGQPKVSDLPKEIQAELTKLSSALNTIEKALLADPNNNDLLNLLRWTQKQELDFLAQLYSPKWQSI